MRYPTWQKKEEWILSHDGCSQFFFSERETEFKFDHYISFLFSKGQASKLNDFTNWTYAPI